MAKKTQVQISRENETFFSTRKCVERDLKVLLASSVLKD